MKTYTIKDRSEFTTCSYCGMPLETGDTVTERDDMPYCSTHCANQDAAYPTRTERECDDENRAALAALDAPQRETLSVLCRRDLHRECDDAAHCVCGCHLKSR